MRIIIDLQGFQYESLHRKGEGKSILALVLAIVRHGSAHEIILALSNQFPGTIEPIRAVFAPCLPQENIRVWHAPVWAYGDRQLDDSAAKIAALIRDSFLNSLNPDIVYFPDHFKESRFFNSAAASTLNTVITLFDPVFNDQNDLSPPPDSAIQTAEFRNENINKANLYLTLSGSMCRMLIDDFQIAADRVVNIATMLGNPWLLNDLMIDHRLQEDSWGHFNAAQHSSVRQSDDHVDRDLLGQEQLEKQSQLQQLGWDNIAVLTIGAFIQNHAQNLKFSRAIPLTDRRPKLAFVSPLAPARTGIADYSAELLPALAHYYDIEVIVAHAEIMVTDAWVLKHAHVRDAAWLSANPHHYDRVLYQFGNSEHHQHMFALLKEIPGAVVLHDFYLSGIVAQMEMHGITAQGWVQALYQGYGYSAVQERYTNTNLHHVVRKFPCNRDVLDAACGVIVHSEHTCRLACQWLSSSYADDWFVIPHLRTAAPAIDSLAVQNLRRSLGYAEDDFVVCSFGWLAETKQNQRLLEAWLASSLSRDSRCKLIYVGENTVDAYGKRLVETITKAGLSAQIQITGWTEKEEFVNYLTIADLAVQLRTHSRGETSGTVLDCMNHGVATIINAHGSLAEIASDAVWMLSDDFSDRELINALERLWQDQTLRSRLGQRARDVIQTQHAPSYCAARYAQAIERSYQQQTPVQHRQALLKSIAQVNVNYAQTVAESMSLNLPAKSNKSFFVDVSSLISERPMVGLEKTYQVNLHTERFIRQVVSELLAHPPAGYRIEPVYARVDQSGYHYAHRFTLSLLGCPEVQGMCDDPVVMQNGDILLILDQHVALAQQAVNYQAIRHIGVKTYAVVQHSSPLGELQADYDEHRDIDQVWLDLVAQCEGLIYPSKSAVDGLDRWLRASGIQRYRPLKLGWAHRVTEIDSTARTKGLPFGAIKTLRTWAERPTFLLLQDMTSQQDLLQTLSAFDLLWGRGVDVNLVIVDSGCVSDGTGSQKAFIGGTVPRDPIALLTNHAERHKHLFWLQGISDEYLEKIYAASACLLIASEMNRFELPWICMGAKKLPLIVRDSPLLRQVTHGYAYYFRDSTPEALATCINQWLALTTPPSSDRIPWATWETYCARLLDLIIGNQWGGQWGINMMERTSLMML